MSAVVSLRQLARIIGVSDKAVRKAERAGVFGPAVRRDAAGVPGVVDLADAVSAWERSGRQLRGSKPGRVVETSPQPSVLPPASLPPASVDAAALDLEMGDDEPELPPVVAASPSLVEAQRQTMLERHRRLKLDNDEREGSLIAIDKAMKANFEFARILRENVMNVPGRIGAQLAAESDAGRVHVLLEAALREALETTANAMDAPPAPETTAA